MFIEALDEYKGVGGKENAEVIHASLLQQQLHSVLCNRPPDIVDCMQTDENGYIMASNGEHNVITVLLWACIMF